MPPWIYAPAMWDIIPFLPRGKLKFTDKELYPEVHKISELAELVFEAISFWIKAWVFFFFKIFVNVDYF